MTALILWIPTNIWDCTVVNTSGYIVIDRWWKLTKDNHTSNNNAVDSNDEYKKTDGDLHHPLTIPITEDSMVATKVTTKLYTVRSPSIGITVVEYFLLLHMIYNFCNERSIIPKYDSGDVGEFFRISQYWAMYGTVGTTSHTTRMIGSIHTSNHSLGRSKHMTKKMDILHWISAGRMSDPTPLLTTDTWDIPPNVSSTMIAANPYVTTYYPNVRWERALHTLSKDSFLYRPNSSGRKNEQQKQRLQYFGSALCLLLNKDLYAISKRTNYKMQQRTWRTGLEPTHLHNMHWLMTESNSVVTNSTIDTVQIPQTQRINSLSEIEIRFQHLQLMPQQRMLRKVSSDVVITVPC
jgi:hypothetical protein